ncbi:hypothetical protein [Photobacterium galatheae]|uniref:Uncharacterized protein n=1 Tax=Photobacterium galatheae TaxID=1654360 RepID=A0A066RPT9_9GAMM|nr:hypothetical protein [Photobacterium galatheae]KDM92485.1 hypothetical protein EA58_05965 [Photobacterium galatheae]
MALAADLHPAMLTIQPACEFISPALSKQSNCFHKASNVAQQFEWLTDTLQNLIDKNTIMISLCSRDSTLLIQFFEV